MKVTKLALPEVLLIEPIVHRDQRGFFMESYQQKNFAQAVGSVINFVQDNHSFSHKGVLRGLHFQTEPKAQGKLVRVINGKVFDVIVDVRKHSANFARWCCIELSAMNQQQLWIYD